MKALVVESYGAEDQLHWRTYDDPVLQPGGVIVAVKAASVDWSDVIQRAGKYPGGPPPPYVVGSGYAGVIAESADPGLAVGTRVFGVCRGSAAELAYVSATSVYRSPGNLSDAEAAGIVGQFFTADVATRMFGRVAPQDSVLVHAGGGSLGSAALQLCRAAGVTTLIATAGSPEKFEFMTQMGATGCIDYQTEEFAKRVMEITDGRGVDLIVDSVGGDVLSASFDCIAGLGRIVCVGASSGRSTSRFRLHTLFEHNISVAGFTLTEELRATRDFQEGTAERVIGMLERGELQPVVRRVFPVTEAAEAHRYLASRTNVGRTVLHIG